MLFKRGDWYWTDFTENGRRYRRPLKTKNWVDASKKEGVLAELGTPKHLFEAIDKYLDDKKIRCAPRTVELEIERLSMVKKFFGNARLSAINPAGIRRYQQ